MSGAVSALGDEATAPTRIGLLGGPNSGKTTLFTALTGLGFLLVPHPHLSHMHGERQDSFSGISDLNLLPIGPLDGSYILPYVLPRDVALKYLRFNQRYGSYVLLGLIVLHFLGVPVVEKILNLGQFVLRLVTIF